MIQWVQLQHFKIISAMCNSHIKCSKYVPASITAWILSLGPSVRYDRAQPASDNTSRSVWWTSSVRAGKHWHTALNGGGGFLLRHRFDSVHVTLRRNGTEVSALIWCRSGSRQPLLSTWSRRSGPSPVTHNTHHDHAGQTVACHTQHSSWSHRSGPSPVTHNTHHDHAGQDRRHWLSRFSELSVTFTVTRKYKWTTGAVDTILYQTHRKFIQYSNFLICPYVPYCKKLHGNFLTLQHICFKLQLKHYYQNHYPIQIHFQWTRSMVSICCTVNNYWQLLSQILSVKLYYLSIMKETHKNGRLSSLTSQSTHNMSFQSSVFLKSMYCACYHHYSTTVILLLKNH